MTENSPLAPQPSSDSAVLASEPKHCSSFCDFVERLVLPRLLASPAHTRLDGQEGVGNRTVAGRFWFDDEYWKVHSDTHYEPLLLAYWHARAHGEVSTFARTSTASGDRLALNAELTRLRGGRPQHLYIYSE